MKRISIKEKIKNKLSIISRNKILIENFSYLSILQIFNLLLPLITFPYLIRVLGKETYGLVIYAQAIIAYLNIIINFGFNISATRDISVNRDTPQVVSIIVNSVLIIKTFLFIISVLILFLIILIFPGIRVNSLLYIFTMGVCIYEVLFPMWYFQGIEQMKYITYINLISRGTFTALIFLLVKSEGDYLLVPILNMLGAIIAGAISIYLLFIRDNITLKFPGIKPLIKHVRESTPFFFSRATGVLIARTNTVLIGSFLGYTEVAYYDLAVKISELCKIPSNLINQTIYPRISVTKNMKMVIKIIKYNLLLSLTLYASIVFLINPIINILGGVQMQPAKYVIFLLNITAVIAGVSYFFGNTMLVVNGYFKEFNRSVIYEASIYILLVSVLIMFNIFNIYAFAFIIIIGNFFEIGYRYFYIKRYKLI